VPLGERNLVHHAGVLATITLPYVPARHGWVCVPEAVLDTDFWTPCICQLLPIKVPEVGRVRSVAPTVLQARFQCLWSHLYRAAEGTARRTRSR
jgi:hypothetical protein